MTSENIFPSFQCGDFCLLFTDGDDSSFGDFFHRRNFNSSGRFHRFRGNRICYSQINQTLSETGQLDQALDATAPFRPTWYR